MTKRTSPPAPTVTRIVGGAAAGSLAVVGLYYVAQLADNESLARGILTGGFGGVTTVVVLLLLARTRFASAESRLAAGRADERESRLATRAGVMAGGVMYAAAVVAVFLSAFGVAHEVGYALIMLSGLATAVLSYAVMVRRR